MGNDETTDLPYLRPINVVDLDLRPKIISALRGQLPDVALHTIAAIIVEVPSYADALSGPMGEVIEGAVRLALGGFLDLASRPTGAGPAAADQSAPHTSVVKAAYDLGRGEVRSGRSMDALLAAYRVGARTSWRDFSTTAVENGLSPSKVAIFAELVFAYIDELSAASAAGHTDELAKTGVARARALEHLSHELLTDASPEIIIAAAERADWTAPAALSAVILPRDQVRAALPTLDASTLQPVDELPGLASADGMAVLLVPHVGAHSRDILLKALAETDAVVGPVRPWQQVSSSYRRALRARELQPHGAGRPFDTDDHLTSLVLQADPEALEDLRSRVLTPIRTQRESTADKLTETLRSWLLHQGRRDDVASELFIHAQTVRYRMGQIRELYGDRLEDPQVVLDLTVALGLSNPVDQRTKRSVQPPDR